MRTAYQIGAEMAMEKTAVLPALLAAKPLAMFAAGTLGRKLLMDVGIGAALGGGLGAATAQPGNRLKAFGQGAVAGGVGGAVFRGAHQGLSMLNATKPVQSFLNNAQGWKGKLMRFGAQPGVGATAASMAVPMPGGHGGAPQPMPAPRPPAPVPMSNVPGYY
jgi:hypothetical protein